MHKVPIQRGPDVRRPGLGKCIYCLMPASQGRLTDEHIIPDGLYGDLVLTEASCDACANAIKIYEAPIILMNFGQVRTFNNIRSKKRRGAKKKSTPKFWESRPRDNGEGPIQYHHVDDDMWHWVWMDLTGCRASILTGIDVGKDIAKISQFSVRNDDKFPKGRSIKNRVFGGGSDQFFAKIAHGFAVAELGMDRFKPYLSELITCGILRSNTHLVGSYQRASTRSTYLHKLSIAFTERLCNPIPLLPASLRTLVVVEIELFTRYGMPKFEVVVGELISSR